MVLESSCRSPFNAGFSRDDGSDALAALSAEATSLPLRQLREQRRQRHRDRMVASPGLAAGDVADVLVQHRDHRHGPHRRLLVRRSRRLDRRRHRRHHHRPEHQRDRQRVLGDDQLGRRLLHCGHDQRRERQPSTSPAAHAYGAGGSYPIAVTITSVGTSQGSSTVNDSAAITAAPSPVVTGTPTVSATGAGFSGSVNPDGLATTAVVPVRPRSEVHRRRSDRVHELDDAAQTVGSDFTSHAVTASVSGLVAERGLPRQARGHQQRRDHVRAGRHVHDEPRTRRPAHRPLGKTFNLAPVSGIVLIKITACSSR